MQKKKGKGSDPEMKKSGFQLSGGASYPCRKRKESDIEVPKKNIYIYRQ